MSESKYLSRKWLLCAYIAIAGTVMRYFDLLDQTGLLSAWGLSASVYGLANVAEKQIEKTTTKETA